VEEEREGKPEARGTGEEATRTAAQLPALTLPVEIRGQAFGTIVAHKPADGGEWTPEEKALLETLGEQLSLALDSARLYQDTQRRAARERLIGDATARMRETLDLETVVGTAAREMRQALGLDRLVVRLIAPKADEGLPAIQVEKGRSHVDPD
jgi:GAF domain-containing protein